MANEEEKSAVDFAAEQDVILTSGGDAALEDMLFSDPRNPEEIGGDADGDGSDDGDGEGTEGEGAGSDQGKEGEQADGTGKDANDGTAQADAENSKAANAAKEAADKASAKAGEGAGAAAGQGDEPTGVQLPSGKVIPYSELTTARQRAAAAEEANTKLTTELAELRTQVDALAKKQGTERDPKAATSDEDPLAGLDPDDFPEPLVKAIKVATDAAKQATERADRAEQQVQTLMQQSQRSTADERQQLIDQNDDLRRWQARGGGLWQDAVAVDKTLRDDPEWTTKSPAERFAEVSRRVREENGMPPLAAPAASSQNSDAGAAGKSSGNGSTKPGAGKAGASQRQAVTSLSDIPGGATPHADQHEAWTNASTAAIASQFEGKSPAQIDELLARYG